MGKIWDKITKKKPPEPATQEEIEQLKLEAEKARLKLTIAKTKEAMPKSGLAKFLSKTLAPKERQHTTHQRAREPRTRSHGPYPREERRDTGIDDQEKRIREGLGTNKDRLPHIKKGFGI